MQFGILGPLEVRSATGETIHVGGPRPRALLVILLLNAGRVVGVEQIIAGQYGDGPPDGAVGAVQAHVSRLRRSLPADLIAFQGAGYRLTVDPEDVDVHRFDRLSREGRRLLTAGDNAGAVAALRAALELWRGPALADLPYGQAQAARLEELRLAASEDLVEAELALPEGSPVAELRALVSAHPLRERPRGQLMRALHASGRQAEALAEFEEARRLLADEFGADPSPELADTHLAILRARQAAPPSRRQGLAAQLTSFVGRERELARLDELRDARLVTIIGPGGSGKTRLVIESAGRARPEVCFADLSPLDSGDQVPQAVLGAVGLRESGFRSPATDPTRRLVAALDRELLLVLDNCEHVIASVAALARTLLAECPGLAILATSREPLGLTGETLLPLAPLDTPPPNTAAGDALAYPAVRLFADRAAAVRPGFTVRQDNVQTVVEICAALDGLPLAVELAAARLRQFTVVEIANRLAAHGHFQLLSRGDRTAAVRQQTLRAAVEWSWDLLGPAEQVLARRFAVFSGGASLAAVEAVCEVADADEVLADLLDRSLVETDGERYRMLDTIRLFCAERLAQAGEQEPLRRAHARYHLELAQRADPHLRRSEQLDWLARLSAEHDNLMAALHWAVRDDRETALRMVAALAAYWWLSGRRGEAGQAAAELLTKLPDEDKVPDGLEEEYVSCVVHAVPKAKPEHWVRAGRIMRTRDRALLHPFGAALWGMAAGPPVSPVSGADRLLGSDPWNVALGRLSHGLLKVLGGRPADGERELLDVLALFRALGERWGTAQALDWLAQVASWRGEWKRAHELWSQALELLEQLGALEEHADLLCGRAGCRVRQGDLDGASADYRRAVGLSAQAGQPGTPPAVQLGLGEIARLRGDTRAAGTWLSQALESAQSGDFGTESTVARALTALGRLAGSAGEPAQALRRHDEALAAARTSPLASVLADTAEGQAGAALLSGSDERAALLLGAAVALRGTAVAGDVDVTGIAREASERLGAAAFAEAFARGAAMTPEQALTALDGAGG
ncbi:MULTISPECIES: BTAD domain-containing putative transcriptional regulator [Pseudofrankia]|uniref:BTAD domain-containing putative transcriptional regulator n=1 Tax=Pseudofrankia TaxID=2994363 RepID=UPI000234DB91|nr:MULTISPECIES: BTAD domain-containing putative transcriptional regulator [Pseudofrankia]OHV38464.1 ATPase [Pseudofrankia sp. EUN1h]